MTRKFLLGLALAVVMVGAGFLRAQDAPEPPEPPDPPEPPQTFILNSGTPHLGVTLDEVTTEKAQELKLPAVAGAIVTDVQKDSAAAKAGIESGDAIIEFDGVRVRSSAELRRLIRETPAGRTVAIKLVRGGKTQVVSAKLEASSDHFNFLMPEVHVPPVNIPEIHMGMSRPSLGISAENLTPQLAQYFGVKQGNGVLVSEVTKDGPADKAGLKAGDVIVQVDGKPVGSVEALRTALNDNFTGDTRKISLTIVRDRHKHTINADLTRPSTWGKRTSAASVPGFDQALAQVRAQTDQELAQLRDLAESQRSLLRSEVLKQQRQVQGEWQRELQEQMRSLKDQLKQWQDLRVTLIREGEI